MQTQRAPQRGMISTDYVSGFQFQIGLLVEILNAWVAEHQQHDEMDIRDFYEFARGLYILTGNISEALATLKDECAAKAVLQ